MRKQSRKRAEELHKELEQTQQNLVQAEEKKRAATKKGEVKRAKGVAFQRTQLIDHCRERKQRCSGWRESTNKRNDLCKKSAEIWSRCSSKLVWKLASHYAQAYKRMEKLAMAHLHSLQEKLCFDCGPCTA
jgi:hypothetical protein